MAKSKEELTSNQWKVLYSIFKKGQESGEFNSEDRALFAKAYKTNDPSVVNDITLYVALHGDSKSMDRLLKCGVMDPMDIYRPFDTEAGLFYNFDKLAVPEGVEPSLFSLTMMHNRQETLLTLLNYSLTKKDALEASAIADGKPDDYVQTLEAKTAAVFLKELDYSKSIVQDVASPMAQRKEHVAWYNRVHPNAMLLVHAFDDDKRLVLGYKILKEFEALGGDVRKEAPFLNYFLDTKNDDTKGTPLHSAVFRAELSSVDYFLKEMPQTLHMEDGKGRTPARLCAELTASEDRSEKHKIMAARFVLAGAREPISTLYDVPPYTKRFKDSRRRRGGLDLGALYDVAKERVDAQRTEILEEVHKQICDGVTTGQYTSHEDALSHMCPENRRFYVEFVRGVTVTDRLVAGKPTGDAKAPGGAMLEPLDWAAAKGLEVRPAAVVDEGARTSRATRFRDKVASASAKNASKDDEKELEPRRSKSTYVIRSRSRAAGVDTEGRAH